jgi:hypothetical protein
VSVHNRQQPVFWKGCTLQDFYIRQLWACCFLTDYTGNEVYHRVACNFSQGSGTIKARVFFGVNGRVKIIKNSYCTFFTNRRTEFMANTTSLNPIIKAP